MILVPKSGEHRSHGILLTTFSAESSDWVNCESLSLREQDRSADPEGMAFAGDILAHSLRARRFY